MRPAPYLSRPVVLLILLAIVTISTPAGASHSWGKYHWARTSTPFTITVIDSMTSDWDDNLSVANSDWHTSSVLEVSTSTAADDDSIKTRKRCPAVSGKVRSCNAEYGRNGWLGLAQIWVSGEHIVQGIAKMNDSYLASSSYTETNRQHVICQEIGHDWGLGHQDESGADLDTCMDYSSKLDNEHPNTHDYEQLETIYNSHTDDTSTVSPLPDEVANADLRAPKEWGRRVFAEGRVAIYERDFGRGFKIITFVIWAEAQGGR